MLFKKGDTSLVKYSLYSIFFFWASLVGFMYLVNKSFFYSFSGFNGAGARLSDSLFSQSQVVENILVYYEKTAELLAQGFSYLTGFSSTFMVESDLTNILLNMFVLAIPFALSFLIFLFILNLLSSEKILVGSIANSSVITFSVFISVMSNNISQDASIVISSLQIAGYAFLNSIIFLSFYLLIMGMLDKRS